MESEGKFATSECGCPVETGLFPYRCLAHAIPRMAMPKSDAARGDHSDWYQRNTCPFCGRVNPNGLACSYVNRCDACGVVSCADHDMATYRLRIYCPKDYTNKRRKHVRLALKALNGLSWMVAA